MTYLDDKQSDIIYKSARRILLDVNHLEYYRILLVELFGPYKRPGEKDYFDEFQNEIERFKYGKYKHTIPENELKKLEGKLCYPGGTENPGENENKTGDREIHEETSLKNGIDYITTKRFNEILRRETGMSKAQQTNIKTINESSISLGLVYKKKDAKPLLKHKKEIKRSVWIPVRDKNSNNPLNASVYFKHEEDSIYRKNIIKPTINEIIEALERGRGK